MAYKLPTISTGYDVLMNSMASSPLGQLSSIATATVTAADVCEQFLAIVQPDSVHRTKTTAGLSPISCTTGYDATIRMAKAQAYLRNPKIYSAMKIATNYLLTSFKLIGTSGWDGTKLTGYTAAEIDFTANPGAGNMATIINRMLDFADDMQESIYNDIIDRMHTYPAYSFYVNRAIANLTSELISILNYSMELQSGLITRLNGASVDPAGDYEEYPKFSMKAGLRAKLSGFKASLANAAQYNGLGNFTDYIRFTTQSDLFHETDQAQIKMWNMASASYHIMTLQFVGLGKILADVGFLEEHPSSNVSVVLV